ncbi:MAG: exosortase H-associated membrane protein [Pseudomonas sp.]|nr:exosortase H-associated membrane protein [Pseudomonas sp.]
MTTTNITLSKLTLRTLLWLPCCLAAWHFNAYYLAAICGELVHLFVNWLLPDIVTSVEQTGTTLAFVTTLKVQLQPKQAGLLIPEVNTLLYTYGLAFFIALMLAVSSKGWQILVGIIVLLLFQSWGVSFDLLAQIGIRLGPDVATQAGILDWHREAIALSYQMGSLIFPTLIPIILWVSFNQRLIRGLTTKFASIKNVFALVYKPQ